mgnify:CR=1 FL=1
MNILVVGNGFDLAHGLPTKYSDFLDFITLYITKYHPGWVRWGLVDDNDNDEDKWKNRRWSFYHAVLESLKSDVSAQTKQLFDKHGDDFYALLTSEDSLKNFQCNSFLRYCLHEYSYKKTLNRDFSWIDIEDEIQRFILALEPEIKTLSELKNISVRVRNCINYENVDAKLFFIPTITDALISKNIPDEYLKQAVFGLLFGELEKFNTLLKLYLKTTMKTLDKGNRHFLINSHEINLGQGTQRGIEIDHVLSFNYTDTAEMYVPKEKIRFINGSLDSSKIILGIENPDLSKTIEFCKNKMHLFFKNTQRVLYNSSREYEKWVTVLKYAKNKEISSSVDLHIIGHSLAISDKYILVSLMLGANKVVIYSHSEKDRQNKISNLYQLLGDELFSKHVENKYARPSISLLSLDELEK